LNDFASQYPPSIIVEGIENAGSLEKIPLMQGYYFERLSAQMVLTAA
jgi:hypothetical protein